MYVIVVANQKGGAGKTNLTRSLAVAAGDGVALIDLDPQGSLTSWWNRRAAETPPLIQIQGSLRDTIAALREAGVNYVFIDTPPAANAALEGILSEADLVLVPVRPTPDDLDAVGPTLELIEKAGRPHVFVLSHAKAGTRLVQEAASVLATKGKVAPSIIHDRVAYPTASITGQTVTDFGPSFATSEVEQLLTYVITQLRHKANT